VRRFADSWNVQYLSAVLLLTAIIAGGVVCQRFIPIKSLVDSIAPPPKPVEGRVVVANSEPADSAAERILAAGLTQAKREGKRVFLHASGPQCTPCQRLNRFLEENRDLFQSDFVDVKVDLEDADFQTFSNGFALLLRLRKKYDGVPWIAILEPDGRIVATSDLPSGKNAGFSESPAGIRVFMQMLRKGIKRTTPEQLARIEDKLETDYLCVLPPVEIDGPDRPIRAVKPAIGRFKSANNSSASLPSPRLLISSHLTSTASVGWTSPSRFEVPFRATAVVLGPAFRSTSQWVFQL
jgi:Thioredoxin-like